ncbi:MAG: hypothetical protein IBX64_06935 [Actinobacteria bacterium]|nr:hypothetical protein [Actinomycetota bacterium]
MKTIALGIAGAVIRADFCTVVQGNALREAGYLDGDILFMSARAYTKDGDLALVRDRLEHEDIYLGFYHQIEAANEDIASGKFTKGEIKQIEVQPADPEEYEKVILDPREAEVLGVAIGVFRYKA